VADTRARAFRPRLAAGASSPDILRCQLLQRSDRDRDRALARMLACGRPTLGSYRWSARGVAAAEGPRRPPRKQPRPSGQAHARCRAHRCATRRLRLRLAARRRRGARATRSMPTGTLAARPAACSPARSGATPRATRRHSPTPASSASTCPSTPWCWTSPWASASPPSPAPAGWAQCRTQESRLLPSRCQTRLTSSPAAACTCADRGAADRAGLAR
jgi:hypothetical protein